MINSATVHVWLPMESTGFNGFIEHAKAKLYKAGTSGHAAIELMFDKNEENTNLVDQYIKGTTIPYQENETHYSLYWSFYSGVLNDAPFYFGNYKGDCLDSQRNRDQIWSEKFKDVFQPKDEEIHPNFVRFIKSVPYVSTISKIPFFEQTCSLLGLDKYPQSYTRTLGIREIQHTSFLESKKNALMDRLLETSGEEQEKIYDRILNAENESKSLGRTPDHSFKFSIQSSVKQDGLILENMLRQMRTIVDKNASFDLYSLNCSETALQILSAGNSLTSSIFNKRGLFFKVANPYLVAELCEKYETTLKFQLMEAPRLKKVKTSDSESNFGNNYNFYQEITDKCPMDALSRCHSELSSNAEKIPYLSSKVISELHGILSDHTAEFACQIYNENGEIELIDPKLLLNQIRQQSFEKARALNVIKDSKNTSNDEININIIDNKANSQNPKKRKREVFDSLN
ncbi:MAG: hypothetical protein U1E78_04220 [Gammaproteobacteria bacterium]